MRRTDWNLDGQDACRETERDGQGTYGQNLMGRASGQNLMQGERSKLDGRDDVHNNERRSELDGQDAYETIRRC